MQPKTVKFKVTRLFDPVKHGGTLEIGKVFEGTWSPDRRWIYYTDANEVEWAFYPGHSCIVL